MLEISCAKARAALTSPPELLTAGMAKVVTAHFAFSPDWDSLRKTAVFSDGWRTVDVLEADWADGCTPIPHEVLQTAGRNVRVGVYGSDSTGVALPTVWAELGRVRPAADPSGDTSTDPTAPVWSQLQGQIGDLKKLKTYSKDSLVAAVNELWHSGGGGGGGGYIIGDGLKLDPESNTLSVDTADKVEKDNTKPVTSAAVHTEVGNINALLATI